MKDRRYLLLYGGPIGDSLVAIHVGRTLAANVPGTKLELLSTRENGFVRNLCEGISFIKYRSLPKESLRSWFALIGLAMSRNTLMVYEPATPAMSPWWRLILWCARRRSGNIELRMQIKGYERPVPPGARTSVISYEETNLFDTPKLVLEAWGVKAEHLPLPTLPLASTSPSKPYLLFCFFAGGFSRSIPLSHAHAILETARTAYPNHELILLSTRKERERALYMAEGVMGTRIESDCTAKEIIALLSSADLVVGTTSGIVLMAAHLRRPLIALHCRSHAKAFRPDFSPETIILSAQSECRCRPGEGNACKMATDEGTVYRCLYFIKTEEVLSAMAQKRSPG